MNAVEVELMEWVQGLGEIQKWQDPDTKAEMRAFVPGEQARSQTTSTRARTGRTRGGPGGGIARLTNASLLVLPLSSSVCLKGLDDLLRRDNSELQPMHLALGSWHTLNTHLLPLLIACCKKEAIIFQLLRVLVRLTQPIAPIVENKILRTEQLQDAKRWVIQADYLTALMWLLANKLETHPRARTDEDRNFVDLLLTLLKNILAVPDPVRGYVHEMKLHDECILKMHEALVFETLGVLATTIDAETDTSTKYLLQECLAHVFRQEKHVEDLFVDEATDAKLAAQAEVDNPVLATKKKKKAAAAMEANFKDVHTLESEQQVQAARDGQQSKPAALAPNKLTPQAAFITSEAARLSANLAATLAATRLNDRTLTKASMARHARFGSKYSVQVTTDARTSNGTPKLLASSARGPDGEDVHCAMPMAAGARGETIFAARLIRNPFAASSREAMVTDSLASHHGKKIALDTGRRVFLKPEVKLALYETAACLLDTGAWHTLCRYMLRELEAASNKDIVVSEDARVFMQLAQFFMAFQRIRSERRVKQGEKVQKEEERKERKVREEQEKKARKVREGQEKAERQEKERAEKEAAANHQASPPAVDVDMTRPASSSSADLVAASSSSMSLSLEAPLFPNAINSQGVITQQEEGVPGVPTPAKAQQDKSWPFGPLDPEDEEADVDMTTGGKDAILAAQRAMKAGLPAPGAVTLATAVAAAAAAPSSVDKKPFVRRVTYDPSPIASSVSFEAWRYLNARLKLCMEDKPVPWAHLAAAVGMYKELLRNLYEMHQFGSVASRLKADGMRRTLFYDRESLELFAKLLQSYNSSAIDHSYLTDLVTAAHYQCKLLEDLAKGDAGYTVLEKRRRVVRRKKEKIHAHLPEEEVEEKAEGEEGQAMVEGGGSEEDQQLKQLQQEESMESEPGAVDALTPLAVKKKKQPTQDPSSSSVRKTLSPPLSGEEEGDEDLAGETNDDEGAAAPTSAHLEEEASAASSDSPGRPAKPAAASSTLPAQAKVVEVVRVHPAALAMAKKDDAESEDESEYEHVLIEEDAPVTSSRRESEFDFDKFFMRFAHQLVVANYLELLGQYRRNHTEVNHMILVFFKRLTGQHLNGYFFQLSAFVLFEQILTDEWVKERKVYDDLRSWVKQLTKQFLHLACRRPTEEELAEDPNTEPYPGRHLWIELLFWKNFQSADRVLNEHGWFDRSQDRAKSLRDAEMLRERDQEWQDIDEDEEEERLAAKVAEQAREDGAEAEAATSEWVDSTVHLRAKPWKPEEDQMLRDAYAQYKENEACWDILQSFFDEKRSQHALKERLKKLGLLEKKERGHKKDPTAGGGSASGSPGRRGGASATKDKKGRTKQGFTLAEIVDRHAHYTRVAPIDEIAEAVRELVVGLMRKDCRATVMMMVEQLEIAAKQRDSSASAAYSSVDAPPTAEPFFLESIEGQWDHDALEEFGALFRLMGIQDVDDRTEATWCIAPHWTAEALQLYIDLIRATVDDRGASERQTEEETRDDEEIARLIAKSQRQTGGGTPSPKRKSTDADGEDDYQPSASAAKAAKRQKRLEKEAREAAELAEAGAALFVERPRRKRGEDRELERLTKEREKEAARRRAQEEEDDGEEGYVPDSSTLTGDAAVAATAALEVAPTKNHGLNDYFAQKRQRGLDAMAENRRKQEEETRALLSQQAERKASKKRAAAQDTEEAASPPKRTKTDGTKKKRLRKEATSDDEEEAREDGTTGGDALLTSTTMEEEDAPTALPQAEDDDALAPLSQEDDTPMAPSTDAAAEDEDEEAPSQRRQQKKKKSARRVILSDEDDEEEAAAAGEDGRAEGQPMEVDTQVDTQAPAETSTSHGEATVPPTEASAMEV